MCAEVTKTWKQTNEERKAIKKHKKQKKLLQSITNSAEQNEGNSTNDTDAIEKVETSGSNCSSRPSTVSLAVPGSILENAQTEELRTYLAGQIARAACIFRIDEVIVFDDGEHREVKKMKKLFDADAGDEDVEKSANTNRTVHSSCLHLARILQYLECPQYLRKFFFPLHKDLKYSGLLNPLDAPHHLRQQSVFRYRDGIVTEKTGKTGCSYINVGFLKPILVNKTLTPGLRVTVKLTNPQDSSKKQYGTVVSPYEPRRETGVYWGYQVRIANSISEIFTKSPYKDGYDVTIGTSDHGKSVEDYSQKSIEYNHLLLVFGGLQGLEYALTNDDKFEIDDPQLLFDHYINVLPRQGCRTIRTEEAILIALSALQSKLEAKHCDVDYELSINESLPQSTDTGGMMTSNTHYNNNQNPKQKQKSLKRKM